MIICKGKQNKNSIIFKMRENGKVFTEEIPFNNYFYLKNKDVETGMFLVREHIKKVIPLKDDYTKIILNNNWKLKTCKKILENSGVTTYEADIDAVKRYYINNQHIKLNHDQLHHCFMDIETYDMKPLKSDMYDRVIANTPILSVAFKDFDNKIHFIRNKGLDKSVKFISKVKELIEADKEEEARKLIKDNEQIILKHLRKGERVLLREYVEYAKQYDTSLAYNGRNFDFAFIKQRMDLYEMNYYDMMLIDLDYMQIYKKDSFANYKSWSLNNVAYQEFKGELSKKDSKYKNLSEISKIDWKETTNCKKYFELFLCYPEILKEYNIQDVNLMLMIERKVKYLRIHSTQSRLVHCPINETVATSRMCDYIMLNEKYKRGIISKSNPNDVEVELRGKDIPGGGFTFSLYPGVWDNVKCYDFHSHYPTVIIDFNISSEMYAGNESPDLSTVFNDEEVSFVEFCVSSAKEFIDKKNMLNKKKYKKHIEEERIKRGLSYNMYDLMWKFVKNYNVNHLQERIKKI